MSDQDREFEDYAGELWAVMMDLLDREMPVARYEQERENERVLTRLNLIGVGRPH